MLGARVSIQIIEKKNQGIWAEEVVGLDSSSPAFPSLFLLFSLLSSLPSFPFFPPVVLGFQLRASCYLGKYSTIEL